MPLSLDVIRILISCFFSLEPMKDHWRDTVDRLQLLDEQLRVLETTAKGMEGGLKNTSKVRLV